MAQTDVREIETNQQSTLKRKSTLNPYEQAVTEKSDLITPLLVGLSMWHVQRFYIPSLHQISISLQLSPICL